MIRLQQHLPGFIAAGTAQIVDCLTWEDLLCVSWVENFMAPFDGRPFHRFSLSPDNDLVAEYDRGTFWWVVGRFHTTCELPVLPPFAPAEDPS